jgi:hypothetical protein
VTFAGASVQVADAQVSARRLGFSPCEIHRPAARRQTAGFAKGSTHPTALSFDIPRLGSKVNKKTDNAYQRSKLIEQRRPMMLRWSKFAMSKVRAR